MLMPTLGLFLILQSGTHLSFLPFELKRLIYIIVLSSSCLLPVSLLPLFLQFKVINSFRMETARERVWPLLFSGIFFLFGYFLLMRLQVPSLILTFLLASLVAVILALLISLFWKISLHMLAVGGVTAVLLGIAFRFGINLMVPVSFMILVSGLVGTARLYLGAHSPAQVYAGYFTGFVVVLSGVFL
jgi:membrane-associated phospholipid phosphatase